MKNCSVIECKEPGLYKITPPRFDPAMGSLYQTLRQDPGGMRVGRA